MVHKEFFIWSYDIVVCLYLKSKEKGINEQSASILFTPDFYLVNKKKKNVCFFNRLWQPKHAE